MNDLKRFLMAAGCGSLLVFFAFVVIVLYYSGYFENYWFWATRR